MEGEAILASRSRLGPGLLPCGSGRKTAGASCKEIAMTEKKTREPPGRPNDNGRNEEAEKLKHGETSKDRTGAPKGRNRSNAGEETS